MRSPSAKIELNRHFFSRNRHREKEYDDIFSTTHKSLSVLSNIILVIIFPPVIVISNLFTNATFLIIMNIFLAVGYCAKFAQKLKVKEISLLDLVISTLFLCMSLVITFYLAPAIYLTTFLDLIIFINRIATGVNYFFLVRNIFLPPFEALIQSLLTYFGHEITTSFFNKAPLTIEKDRFVIDRLLRKFYKHDSCADEFKADDITPFNNIILMLSGYINKYNAPFLGNLINHDRINILENSVSQLIINGNTDTSIAFIKRKIDFKRTKASLLNKAKNELINNPETYNSCTRFFKIQGHLQIQSLADINKTCILQLEKEISRQNDKIEQLQLCLPKIN